MLEFKGVVDPALFAEFCDAADPAEFAAAARWLKRARDVVVYGETPRLDIPLLGLSAWSERGVTRSRAWQLGYAVARAYRELLAVGPMALVVPESLLTVRRISAPSAGLEGLVVRQGDSCVGAVLPALPARARRFAAARALGLTLLTTDRAELLLDPAPTTLTKASRAFAAELLAPAEGIWAYLAPLPAPTTSAFDAIAARYRVDSSVVQHQ